MDSEKTQEEQVERQHTELAIIVERDIARTSGKTIHQISNTFLYDPSERLLGDDNPDREVRHQAKDVYQTLANTLHEIRAARAEVERNGYNHHPFDPEAHDLYPESVLAIYRQFKFNLQNDGTGEPIDVTLKDVVNHAKKDFYIKYKSDKRGGEYRKSQVDLAYRVYDVINQAIELDSTFPFKPSQVEDPLTISKTFVQDVTNKKLIDLKTSHQAKPIE